jgi:predicted molibdopterin-dependent oxidoreductase YjgC
VEILGRASRRQLPVLLLLGGSVSEEVPDSHLVDTALRSAYVVSNAAHLEDPDVAYTDLLLPGGTWYDREGHYISSERRVALSWPVFPLETRGWRTIYVLSKIGGAMGPPELFDENESSWSWMRELAEVTRGTPADLTHLPLLFDLREARGVQWPVATERSASFGGTARRHMGQDGRGPGFPTESGKAVVLPREHPGLRRATDPAYPLRAVMGLDIGTWWDGTFFELTGGEVERSRVRRGAYVEMTREDAQDLGLAEMALALVTSLSGEVELPVRYAQTGTVRGHVFIPWGGDKRTQVLAPSFPLDRNGVPPWSVFHVRVEVAPPAGEE